MSALSIAGLALSTFTLGYSFGFALARRLTRKGSL